ncbi:nucleoside permease [Bacillus paramycoides]|uniref:nucleoside permease n=1 Tax=Bacillus paramycoides TaxID=2026194 RepID=UPI002E1D2AD3
MALDRWLTDEEYAKAKANGISRKLVYNRVYVLGWDVEIAMTAPSGSVRHKTADKVHGKWLRIAVENGIEKSTFYSRLNLGWKYEDAATKPANRMTNKEKEWSEIAEKNGISYQTFTSRRKYGWEPEKAATTPVMTPKQCGARSGRKRALFTDEQVEQAKLNEVSRQALRRRVVEFGWQLDEAIATPPLKKWNPRKKRNIS